MKTVRLKAKPGVLSTVDQEHHYWTRAHVCASIDLELGAIVSRLRRVGANKAADAVARSRKSVQGARNNARGHANYLQPAAGELAQAMGRVAAGDLLGTKRRSTR